MQAFDSSWERCNKASGKVAKSTKPNSRVTHIHTHTQARIGGWLRATRAGDAASSRPPRRPGDASSVEVRARRDFQAKRLSGSPPVRDSLLFWWSFNGEEGVFAKRRRVRRLRAWHFAVLGVTNTCRYEAKAPRCGRTYPLTSMHVRMSLYTFIFITHDRVTYTLEMFSATDNFRRETYK